MTVNGVYLYRWYQMGITDPADLQWLLSFYYHDNYKLPIVMFALQEARRYFEEQD